MREIKFRFWDGKYFDAVTRIDWDDSGYPTHVETYHETFDQVVDGDGKSRALEEYTGRNDCDGRPIYEGDIVDLKLTAPVSGVKDGLYDFRGIVEMCDGSWAVSNEQLQMLYRLDREDLEPHIAGNIYDNPELMEKNDEN